MNHVCIKEFRTRAGKEFKYGNLITDYQHNLLNVSYKRNFVPEDEFVDKREPVKDAPAESFVPPTPQEITQYDLQDESVPTISSATISIDIRPASIAYYYNGYIVYKGQPFNFEIVSHKNEDTISWTENLPTGITIDLKKIEEQIITHFQESI